MAKSVNASTTYTVNMPHQAAWIVYINGIEVPINSVNVEFGVWSIPTAQIRLVPHVLLQRIGHEDRLQVEVYYLDLFFDPDNPRFCLFGEFEVVGWSYQTTSAGRFLQLDCRSPLKILEQLRFYYMSSLSDMAKGLSAPTSTDANTYVAPTVSYPLSLFNQGLIPDPNNPEAFISTPFEFIRNILKALTAPIDLKNTSDTTSTDGSLPRTASGVAGRNFFGRWMEMTDFRRRWVALPYFDDDFAKSSEGCFPIMKAVKSTEVLNALKQQIGDNVGDSGTAWELLQRVFGTMLMEILAVPAPAAVQLVSKTNLVTGMFAQRGGGTSDTSYGGLVSYVVKPQCIFGIPPSCNIIFPSMIKTYATSENYESQPTRIYLGEAYVSSLISSGASGDMQTLAGELLVTGYPGIVRDRLEEARTTPGLSSRNFLIYPEELYKGPVSKHLNAPSWLYMLEKLGQKAVAASRVKVKGRAYSKGKGNAVRLEQADKQYGPVLREVAKAYGVPEVFLWGIIGHESEFNITARNRVDGGGGLMQLMHSTFIGNYKEARTKNPKLDPLPMDKYGKPNDVVLRSGRIRKVYGEPIYKDLHDPQKNLYAGTNYLSGLLKLANVNNFSLEETNPNNAIPSPLQCALLGYNAGPDATRALMKKRMEYFAKPEGQRDASIFEKGEKYVSPMTGKRDTIAHWRVYSTRVYKFQKLAYAYMQLQKPGDTVDAPSSPSAPAVALPGDAGFAYEQDQSVPGEDPTNDKLTTPTAATETNTATPANEDSSNAMGWNNNTAAAGNLSTQPSFLDASESSKALGELFKTYAKYEYYRSRFETRSATLTLSFNPYIIPGFSAIVLDNSISNFHVVGYVNSVSHSFSAEGSILTNVVLSYVRTLPEYLKIMVTGSNDLDLNNDSLNADIAVGPTEVIAEVANVFQVPLVAEDFYQTVLYAGVSKGMPVSFEIEDGLVLKDMEGNPVSSAPDLPDSPNSWTPDKGLMVEPTENFKSYFSSYDSAMSFVSRPVATLEQMVELRHGRTLKELSKDSKSEVQGPLDSFTSNNKSARFYSRIYSLVQPAGEVQNKNIQAITNVGNENASLLAGEWQVITADHNIPESRRNWDQVLIKYRNAVRGKTSVALL